MNFASTNQDAMKTNQLSENFSSETKPTSVNEATFLTPIADIHLVLISDETGILTAFNLIKSKLFNRSADFLTLIYSVSQLEDSPLFKSELNCLEKRFSHQLEIHYIINTTNISINETILQETLEVVINCNISTTMLFQAVGNVQLVEFVLERLCYLGIQKNQIIT